MTPNLHLSGIAFKWLFKNHLVNNQLFPKRGAACVKADIQQAGTASKELLVRG